MNRALAHRPHWVGLIVDVVAILAAILCLVLHAISGKEFLAWIGLVQSGRLFVWATMAAKPALAVTTSNSTESVRRDAEQPKEGPGSGLLVIILAFAGVIHRMLHPTS